MISSPTDWHQLLDAAPSAMVVVDRLGRVSALNPAAERILGWTEDSLLGEPIGRLIPEAFHPTTRGGTVRCFARRRDGSACPVEVARRPLGTGGDARALLTLRAARRTPSPVAGQARATLESIGDAVITTDTAGLVTYLNPAAERLTGWGPDEALGQSLDRVLPLVAEATRRPIMNTAARCLDEGRSIDLEDGVLLLRRDGTEVPIGDSAAPLRDRNGGTIGAVLVIQNETAKRRASHRLSSEAAHDPLTGLINRREFERRLARVVSEVPVASKHGLICLDLDRFKLVNDTGGHDAGDDLLRRLSSLLRRSMRKRDTVARFGGDEFAILLEDCPPIETKRIAEGLRAVIEQFRFEWKGRPIAISASLGLVPITAESGDMAAVLLAADAACYRAKERGGNRVEFSRSPDR